MSLDGGTLDSLGPVDSLGPLDPLGSVALVSGGSRSIGAAIVRRLAEAGWDIGFSYLGDEQGDHRHRPPRQFAVTAPGA